MTETDVLISVSDNGPGIPAAELRSVFQRFHHFTSAEGGSGLGLAIARAIVELSGGRIWAQSQAEEGTTFWIALPHAINGGTR
jgi:two-component system sensor histidine kinase VicK